jgi:hypothetical protein
MSTGWTPKAYFLEPLLEWSPQSLPGYAEAAAKVARGEALFPPRAKGTARRRRTVAELTAERDRLVAERDRIAAVDNPRDTAAGRLGRVGMRQHHKNTDSRLVRYSALTRRIDMLEYRIGANR